MRHFGMPPGYDRYKLATPPEYDDAYFGLEPQDEEELPEPEITEEWNASRGEWQTVVTFASGKKFAVCFNRTTDSYDIHGLDGEYFDGYETLARALDYLLDMEPWVLVARP